jgi:hypothetical protein
MCRLPKTFPWNSQSVTKCSTFFLVIKKLNKLKNRSFKGMGDWITHKNIVSGWCRRLIWRGRTERISSLARRPSSLPSPLLVSINRKRVIYIISPSRRYFNDAFVSLTLQTVDIAYRLMFQTCNLIFVFFTIECVIDFFCCWVEMETEWIPERHTRFEMTCNFS